MPLMFIGLYIKIIILEIKLIFCESEDGIHVLAKMKLKIF